MPRNSILPTHRERPVPRRTRFFAAFLLLTVALQLGTSTATAETPEEMRARADYMARAAPAKEIGPTAVRALVSYAWPGNVRELRHVMERAAVLVTGDEIGAADLRLEGLAPAQNVGAASLVPPPQASSNGLRGAVRDAERVQIEEALAACQGNVSAAAKKLGVSRHTLHRRIKELGLRAQG